MCGRSIRGAPESLGRGYVGGRIHRVDSGLGCFETTLANVVEACWANGAERCACRVRAFYCSLWAGDQSCSRWCRFGSWSPPAFRLRYVGSRSSLRCILAYNFGARCRAEGAG